MSALRRRLVAVVVVLAVGSGAFIGGHAIAAGSGTPANKVVASGAALKPITTSDTIMEADMHTSKTTDVMFQVTLECSLFTALKTDNTNKTANAHSTVVVWVEVDNKIVAIEQQSAPPQTPPATGGSDKDKVTFCDREYQRTVSNGEQLDTLNQVDTEDDYIRTKSSHAFNWVRMNMGSGDHHIKVKAEITNSAVPAAAAKAEAIIGNRTLIAEPTKMANDAIISPTGS